MGFMEVKEAAKNYEGAMTKFLRDLIAIPGESYKGNDRTGI